MTKKAVLYARVSGDDRGKDNLKGQLEMGREYALAHGYAIIDEIAEDDRGARGVSFDLPGLNQALEMARNGELDVLVVRELDRFARKLAKQLIVESEFKRAGVEVEYVLGEYPDTPEGNLNKQIRAVIAEYEATKITERVVRARRNIVKKGKIMLHGNAAPYGYRASEDRTTLVPYEPEAHIIRSIFQWYTGGSETGQRLTTIQVAERLSDMRVPTWMDIHGTRATPKKREYGQWAAGTVSGILHNEVYKGIWHYGKAHKKRGPNPRDHWIPLEVPPLVSCEVWEAAQKRCKQNQIMAKRNTKNSYLMHYLLTCQRCGRSTGTNTTRCNGKPYAYYMCYGRSNHKQSPREKCALPFFRADHVDAVVWDWVRDLLLDPVALDKGLREEQEKHEQANQPLRERQAVIDDLLTDNQARLGRLLDLYLSGDFDREMLTERKERLEGTIEALGVERAGLVAMIEKQELNEKQIKTIQDFASRVARGLGCADENFDARRRIILLLNVKATLAVEDGQKVVYVRCMLDEDTLLIDKKATGSGQTKTEDKLVLAARLVLPRPTKGKRAA